MTTPTGPVPSLLSFIRSLAPRADPPQAPARNLQAVLRIRHGANLGRLIAALGNDPYHSGAPFGVPPGVEDMLKRLRTNLPGALSKRGPALLDLIADRARAMDTPAAQQQLETLGAEHGPQMARLLFMLGDGAQVEGGDVVVPSGANPGQEWSASDTPHVFELLAATLTSRVFLEAVWGQPPQATTAEAGRIGGGEAKVKTRESGLEAPKRRLARLTAARARYFIPDLLGWDKESLDMQPEMEPEVSAVHAVGSIKPTQR